MFAAAFQSVLVVSAYNSIRRTASPVQSLSTQKRHKMALQQHNDAEEGSPGSLHSTVMESPAAGEFPPVGLFIVKLSCYYCCILYITNNVFVIFLSIIHSEYICACMCVSSSHVHLYIMYTARAQPATGESIRQHLLSLLIGPPGQIRSLSAEVPMS